MGYDIIGDIHGHADALTPLLQHMGYRRLAGAWRHPERQAIFIGDFIDRGPQQIETVRIVRDMVESGAALAVMGNHEFNAIAWDTEDPRMPGQYLRPHLDRYYRQHAAFLSATDGKPDQRKSILDWFKTLPLWLDLPGLRAVHACWSPTHMALLAPRLQSGCRLSQELLVAACRRGSPEYRAVEWILKGPEVKLPGGIQAQMGDALRAEARTRWWDKGAVTIRQSAIVDGDSAASLPDSPVPPDVRAGYDGDRPVFIGHYWMRGRAAPLHPRVACVDYSAGRGEPLVAYRWDGERDLDSLHFVTAVNPS